MFFSNSFSQIIVLFYSIQVSRKAETVEVVDPGNEASKQTKDPKSEAGKLTMEVSFGPGQNYPW